jgi:hypothetical protein
MMTNRHSSLLTKSVALTLFVIALPGIACAFDPYGTWMRPSTDNADNGKIYTGVVTMQGPNALNLKGCVAFICQGETWTKIK